MGKGEVEYVVESSRKGFSITYENSNGQTEQADISSTSWKTSFTGYDDDFVYISAQADNENTNISVYIYYRGKEFKKATSYGDYVIATASGSLK